MKLEVFGREVDLVDRSNARDEAWQLRAAVELQLASGFQTPSEGSYSLKRKQDPSATQVTHVTQHRRRAAEVLGGD